MNRKIVKNKWLALMLVISVVLGQLVFAPQYIEADGGISVETAKYVGQADTNIDFTIDGPADKWFYFVPAKDTEYTITGYEPSFDATCDLYRQGDTVTPLASGDDENGSNFEIKYVLQANVKYYLKINAYEYSSGYFKITGGALATPGAIGFELTEHSMVENFLNYGFTVVRQGGAVGTASIDYEVTGGTAIADEDYILATGTLDFADGEAYKNIDLNILNDMISEPDETVQVTLSNPQGLEGVSLGNSVATLTITDDDVSGPGTFQFSPTSVTAGEGAGSSALTVTRTDGSTGAVTVDYAVTGGTATEGSDFEAVSGTLSFADGDTSKTIPVNILPDTMMESDETVEVTLSNASAGTLHGTDSKATVTITDDDSRVELSPAAISYQEGNTATFVVSRLGVMTGTVTVDYAVNDVTASAYFDYSGSLFNGTLTFAPGEAMKQITITLNDDDLCEGDETVEVTLSNVTGDASLGINSIGTLTILDRDSVLQFSSSAVTAGEGDGTVDLTVTRTGSSIGAVTVDYAVTSGNAATGTDYTLTAGTLTFDDGVISKKIPVTITDDSLIEGEETVEVTLSNVGGEATIGTNDKATLTITDNDVPIPGTFQLSAASVSAMESDGNVGFTVNRAGGSDGAVALDYTVSGTATSGVDYVLSSGTLNFADQEVSKTIPLSIVNDKIVEADKTVIVTLTSASNGASIGIQDTSTLTITDDDSVIEFGSVAPTIGEGGGSAYLTITRTGYTVGAVTVDYAVTGGTAAAGTDFSLASGTLSFAAGETSKLIPITITDDSLIESNETVEVTLSNPVGEATIGTKAKATLTIEENDIPVPGTFQFNPTTLAVGESDGSTFFTVIRSGGSDGTVQVNYSVTGGTASIGSDYTLADGTLTFADGETSKTIPVTIVNDKLAESNETIEVKLGSATNGASVGSNDTVTLTITDDDSMIICNPSTVTAYESSGTAYYTVTRTGSTAGEVAVDYEVTGGTALKGTDYNLENGTITFADQQSSKMIPLSILNDKVAEADKTVIITLKNATNEASIGAQDTSTLTITDDDSTIEFSSTAATVGEGDGSANLTVTRTGYTAGAVTVDYAVTGGSATAGTDYVLASGTLSFAAGETSKLIPITITDDSLIELNETVEVTLSNPVGEATIGTKAKATLTIEENDIPVPGTFQFNPTTLSVGENDGNTSFTVVRSGGSDGTVLVNYSVTGGTASKGTDYTLADGTLTFTDGETSKTVPVTIVNDKLTESNETVEVKLGNATNGASVGSNDTVTLTITDDDSVIEFSSTTATVGEGDGSANLAVTRTGYTAGAVTVDYAVTSGSATAGTDYVLASGTLSFAAGETSKLIPITITDDNLIELKETVEVTLSNPVGEATIGTKAKATLTIEENDIPVPGTFQFNPTTLSVGESDGNTSFTIVRSGGSDGMVQVNYSVTGGTASKGTDYTLADGTLTFADGETSKTITVTIVKDKLAESNETVEVKLGSATNGASVGTDAKVQLTILDNDSAIQFGTDKVIASKDAESAEITVIRSGNTSGTVMVDYTITGGTAVNGTDYKRSAGTLTFAAGEQSKTISITNLNKNLAEPRTVEITLNNVTGEASLGSISKVLLTIQKKEAQDTTGGSTSGSTGGATSTSEGDSADSNQKGQIKDGINTIISIAFKRASNTAGEIEDTLTYSVDKVKQTIEELKKEGSSTADILIPDDKDEVSKSTVNLPKDSLAQLSSGDISLNIWTKNAAICLPALSLEKVNSELKGNLYFNLVPVKGLIQKKEALERAKQEVLIQNTIKDSSISVVGRPMTIETNMPSAAVEIILPLTGVKIPTSKKDREAFLDTLGVYIEHSDGTKELVKGDMVTFGDGLLGIKFGITKFSTFTILQSDSLKEKSSLCKITKVSAPAKAVIAGKKVTATVDSSVKTVTVKLSVSKNSSWKLYKDAACAKEIEKRKLSLSAGKNTIYVKVTAENGTSAKYSMVITRKRK
ncbi:MAG TPA: Calx-beta domain-containing protein [Lachnospiraceae bacterium]|nr:Calx-beta domain-containing protein [Lachnospiraceae bacterium]